MKNKLCTLVALLICCVLTACQHRQPQEVILRPTMLPEVVQNTSAVQSIPEKDEMASVTPAATSVQKERDDVPEESQPLTASTPSPTPTASPMQAAQREVNHYFVQQESKEVQALFEYIYSAIMAHQEKIQLPENTSREHTERAMWLLTNDCPELFWFSHISELEYMENTPELIESVTATYRMSAEKVQAAQKSVDVLVEDWLKATDGLSDYDKELFVHDAILDSCKYANASDHDGTIYGALVLGKARCEGYANALCFALRRMGIPCAVVTGAATNAQGTENHAWNLARIDGTWTWIDPTWNDPVGRSVRMYGYFNVSDSMISTNHTVDTAFSRYELPACTDIKQNHSVKNQCYIKDGEDVEQGLIRWGAAYLKGEDAPLCLRFETAAQYEQAMGMLAQCLQEAANQTGKIPGDGKFHYLTEPMANYLQFE